MYIWYKILMEYSHYKDDQETLYYRDIISYKDSQRFFIFFCCPF